MTNFKHKLDHMMGDTSRQEDRIKAAVRQKLTHQPQQKRKFSWQMPVVATAFVILTIFLVSTMYTNNELTAKEGRGVPYDPTDDLFTISTLKAKGALSAIDYGEFLELPTLKSLEPLEYIDNVAFEMSGEAYHTVIERKEGLYEGAVYDRGDIVRTMSNAGGNLPIYEDEYYEVIAVPGDRVVIQDGEMLVNGKKVKSSLMDVYKQVDATIAGGYDQLLNAREYVLLNRFPAVNSVQATTITYVHKIYGEVVGITKEADKAAIYLDDQLENAANYSPADYFDMYLYDSIFGDGKLARMLTYGDDAFPTPNRLSELFLEADYREEFYLSDTKAQIRYYYEREGSGEFVIHMYKDEQSNIWKWGL